MLDLFRKAMKSKFGTVFALAFLVLIVLAFALADVSNSGSFGGVTGSDRVAIVGDAKISTSDLSVSATSALQRIKQQNPTYSMEAFLAEDGLDKTLDQLIERTAIAEFGRLQGLRAGDRLIDSELVKIPAFFGPDGRFNEDTFRNALRGQGLTEEILREDVGNGLLVQQLLRPVTLGSSLPDPLLMRYAALLKESRKGSISVLPSKLYAPTGKPTDAQVQAYYRDHKDDYIRPERRVIHYAVFGNEALGELTQPTDAEIAARYKRDQAKYAATENRTFTQLVVPTKPAADAIIAEVKGGKSLDQAAREKGLAVAEVGPFTQAQFSASTTQSVGQAGFAAKQGEIAAPTRGALGYYILRVDKVETTAGRSVAQARGDIVDELMAEKKQQAIADLTASIEESFDGGESLQEVATAHKIKLQSTPPVIADGTIYGEAPKRVDASLMPVLPTAFSMDEGSPQIAVAVPGQSYVIFDVTAITPSASAPLAEIREAVVEAWRMSEGSKAAKLAADRVLKRIASGKSFAAAMAEEGKPLPPPDNVNMTREELAGMGGRVPAVLALLFSMAEGSEKRLEAPNSNGWFVVQLDDIVPGKVSKDDPELRQARQELNSGVGDELSQEFSRAVQAEIGVERNKAAIAAVQKQLSGQTN